MEKETIKEGYELFAKKTKEKIIKELGTLLEENGINYFFPEDRIDPENKKNVILVLFQKNSLGNIVGSETKLVSFLLNKELDDFKVDKAITFIKELLIEIEYNIEQYGLQVGWVIDNNSFKP